MERQFWHTETTTETEPKQNCQPGGIWLRGENEIPYNRFCAPLPAQWHIYEEPKTEVEPETHDEGQGKAGSDGCMMVIAGIAICCALAYNGATNGDGKIVRQSVTPKAIQTPEGLTLKRVFDDDALLGPVKTIAQFEKALDAVEPTKVIRVGHNNSTIVEICRRRGILITVVTGISDEEAKKEAKNQTVLFHQATK